MKIRTVSRLVDELARLAKPPTYGGGNNAAFTPSMLIRIFRNTELEKEQWLRYALHDHKSDYTKNLIARLPNDSKLMLLLWPPGKRSPIHSHGNTHCVMKMMAGRLTEHLYRWPHQGANMLYQQSAPALQRLGQRDLQGSKVAYMADEMGLHSIGNANNTDYAVSLHLYMSRPDSDPTSTQLVDEQSGSLLAQTQLPFYSEGGLRLETF